MPLKCIKDFNSYVNVISESVKKLHSEHLVHVQYHTLKKYYFYMHLINVYGQVTFIKTIFHALLFNILIYIHTTFK